jgi:hypothetical protein
MATDDSKKSKEAPVKLEAVSGLSAMKEKIKPEVVETTTTREENEESESEKGDLAEVAPGEEKAGAVFVSQQPVSPKDGQADRLSEAIDDILEDNLADLYKSMNPSQQAQFKQKGEETVSKIRELVQATKINAKKIFNLIREWLKMIPGVNRFFL